MKYAHETIATESSANRGVFGGSGGIGSLDLWPSLLESFQVAAPARWCFVRLAGGLGRAGKTKFSNDETRKARN